MSRNTITIVLLSYDSSSLIATVDFASPNSQVSNADKPGTFFTVAEFLKSKESPIVASTWLWNATRVLAETGAGMSPPVEVLGASLINVKDPNATPAPAVCEELCFYDCDCIISAVIAGVAILAAIVIITCVLGKLCGNNDNKKKDEKDDLDRNQEQELQHRRSSLVLPQLAPGAAADAPLQKQATAVKYEVDEDL